MPLKPDRSANGSLQRLLDGNRRFVQGAVEHPRQDAQTRRALLAGQRPFAVVLGCSDSRISPELLFDQGLGDLFVIRVAGNVIGEVAIASVEYAVAHLGVPLIVVLAHSSCGAVTATLAGGRPEGNLGALTERIGPAIAAQVSGGETGITEDGQPSVERVDEAARANAEAVAAELRRSQPVISPRITSGKTAVVAAFYDMASGEVHVLGT